MFPIVGRLVARKDVAGLYLPVKSYQEPLYGIYDIVEVMGEMTIKYVGEPADNRPMSFTGQDLEGLFLQKERYALTTEERKLLGYKT